MRVSPWLVTASVISLALAQTAQAQPRPYGEAWRSPPASQYGGQHGPDRHDDRSGPQPQGYYYNGRWVDGQEWQNRSNERDRWARTYQKRHRKSDDSSALIAGIIGFALGAAIVGSAQEADHARQADSDWDHYCSGKYRSYDRSSRTYLGRDGLRHYCR